MSRIETEHEADVIASALHDEVPWMSRATEVVWHGLRDSVRQGLSGLRFPPVILIGPPGVGKSHWCRYLARRLEFPMVTIDATGEPASFALVGSQRGWSNAAPGRLVSTILRERHAGPLVIVDEVEKAGNARSTKGTHHALTNALLPLLEPLTARWWSCPYYQVPLDMTWTNYVMTANSRTGIPEPLLSRCVVVELDDLTPSQLQDFARREGVRRCLPDPALTALLDVLDLQPAGARPLSLRTVSRMLDRAERLCGQPMLH